VIDGVTDTVSNTISVGDHPEGIATNPTTNKIYVINSFDKTISVIDGATTGDIIPPTFGPFLSPPPQFATSSEGALVDYELPFVMDDIDLNPTISCEPSSGSLFPIGSTTVTCIAEDDSRNTSTLIFTVSVEPPLVGFACSPLFIDELISSEQYNVIDNRDGLLGNVLTGTIFNDLILASDAGNVISGMASADCIIGGAGNDIINGNAGQDQIFGNNGSDQLIGGFGNDLILGGSGNDEMSGGFGNDAMDGGPGSDTIQGQLGRDFLNGGTGDDSINGGLGDDICISDAKDTIPAILCVFFEN